MPVKDPGERSISDGGVTVSSNRAPREPAAERFLHYEPPGSTVGDTGELTPRIREPQISPSTKFIRDLIRRWADTLLSRDLAGHMSLYAVTLDRFNGSSNVPRDVVRASKQRLLAGFAGVRRFEMYDVRLLPSRDGSVTAEFRIESDAAARDVVGWYRLHLRQVDGQWKINGEEKLEPVSRRGGH
jgi:ketosteroid isomerase-like protein